MKYYKIILIVTFAFALLNNSMSFVDVLFHSISLLLMLFILEHFPFFKHFGKHLVLLTFWISLMFMPAFHLVKALQGEDSTFGYRITAIDYEHILSFGSKVLLVTCFTWILSSFVNAKRRKEVIIYKPHLISRHTINYIFVIMYLLSLFSLSIGLSRMGAHGIELPFHLAGIITLIRISFFPMFFAVIVENYILNKKSIPKKNFILLFVWALLETVVRLSKAALLGVFMPVGIVLYMYYRPSWRTLLKYVVPIFAIFILLYPIIEIMRNTDEGSLSKNISTASKQVENQDETTNPFIQPLNRAFMIPALYAKDYNWVDQTKFFDFSKAPVLVSWGGAARYQTFVIDGYPLGIAHSSGTTGLEDPLLHGGYGLCFIVIILLMIMANAIDSLSNKHMNTIYIFLVLLLWGFCKTQNISSIYDAIGMQYMLVRFAIIYIAYYINFRRKIVV